MRTTPNSPIVCANVSTVAVKTPGRTRGSTTLKKASMGLAPKVAATSIGRSPNASNAPCRGCTAKGNE